MPNNVYIIMGLCALLGLLLLWRGMHNFFNTDLRKFRGLLQLISSAVFTSIAAVLIIASINLNTYRNFSQESILASIEFEELKHDPGRFIATLSVHGGLSRRYELRGDQWQIDARMIKWNDLATQLGLMPLYQFDRLSGRYSTAIQQNTEASSANDLLIKKGIDVWKLAKQFKQYLPFVDASYGSATYQVMQHGLKFDIALTHSGLITRPAP